jgi:tRNA-specific 2-thiouridylase
MQEMVRNSELIIVAMSGGVDSSVAALALKNQGRKVAGMFMKNWEEDDRFGACSADEDVADADAVAGQLGIPLHRRNFSAEYWDFVFENFLDEYKAGRTPNPDILCNREIKFRTFLDHARDLGAERIATGHYARTDQANGEHRLLRGKDNNKDQSYFLYTLGQDQLAFTEFPVGEMDKPDVRRFAEKAGFNVHDKKDSTGICFIGERPFREFLATYLPANPGRMRTPGGQDMGEHQGLMYYTLGQRKGLQIGGKKDRGEEPWYVVGKDLHDNALIVAQGEHDMLFSEWLIATDTSWIGSAPAGLDSGFRCHAKVRYRQADQDCTVKVLEDGKVEVQFDERQKAVAPGQFVVFYEENHCLGGAVIDQIG